MSVGRQAGEQRGGGDARHTPPHPKAFRHFLTCMGLEQLGSSAYPPFDAYLWSVSFFAVKGLASERHFFDLSLLRIPSPRARSHNLRSPLLQPHHGGFLERISDMHLQQGGWRYRRVLRFFCFLWLKTRCSNAPPTSAETEGRDTSFIFFRLIPFLGWIPVGTRTRAAG